MLKSTERLFLSDECLKTCRAIIIFSIFIFSSKALPQRLSGNVLISTSKLKQTTENIIVQKKPIVGSYADNIELPTALPVQLKKVDYKFDWQRLDLSPWAANNIRLTFVKPRLEILIPQLAIDTYVIKEINGAVLKVHIKSSCQNIVLLANTETIELESAVRAAANADTIDIQTSIDQINLGLPALQLQDFQCDNVVGIQDIVADEILKQFSHIEFFKPVLLDKLNDLLSQQVKTYTAKAEAIIKKQIQNYSDLQSLRFSLLQINDNYLDIAFSTEQTVDTIAPIKNYKMSADIALAIDKDMLQNHVKKTISDKLSRLSYSSKNIPELDKLTRSRLKQFFVWPALMKRPKGKELVLRPILDKLNFVIKPDIYVKAFSTQAVAGLWIIDGAEPMLYLRSQLQAQSAVASNKLQSSINNLQTVPQWDQSYVRRHDCSKRISTSIVDTLAQKYFTDRWATVSLATILPIDSKTAQLKDIFLAQDKKLYFNFYAEALKATP